MAEIDPGRLERWLAERAGLPAARVRSIEFAEGGVSNLTCRVRLEGAPWAEAGLRVERAHGIFEPYDVLKEASVMRCLQDSRIPVPEVYAWEAGKSWLGERFLLMQWIDAPHMGEAGAEASFEAFTEMVARIHEVDWRDAGLAFLGVPPSPREGVQAEVQDAARRMVAFGCGAEPLLAGAARTLLDAAPDDGRSALCHGDINVFNYLFRAGSVAGVVDWERARIGDPRSDIGQLVALSHLKGSPWLDAQEMPFVRAYAAVSGRELPGMAYFRARWLFELAVIYHGWVQFNGTEPWYSRERVMSLLEAALTEVV